MIARLLLWSLGVAALAGCQTTGVVEPARVPAVLQPLFMPCVPTDGALSVQLFKDGGESLEGSIEVEWVAHESGDWELEALNAVGLTVLKVSRQGQHITAGGSLAAKLPRLGVAKGGFLTVNGDRIGVKAGEVPCLLVFRLPRAWLSQIASLDVEGKHDLSLELRDPDGVRDVEITARRLGDARPADVCTRFSWTRYLLFHPAVTWCQTTTTGAGAVRPVATLGGIEDHVLKWVRIDEP